MSNFFFDLSSPSASSWDSCAGCYDDGISRVNGCNTTCLFDFLVLQVIARLGERLETERGSDYDEYKREPKQCRMTLQSSLQRRRMQRAGAKGRHDQRDKVKSKPGHSNLPFSDISLGRRESGVVPTRVCCFLPRLSPTVPGYILEVMPGAFSHHRPDHRHTADGRDSDRRARRPVGR